MIICSIDYFKWFQSGWNAGPLDDVLKVPSLLIKEWGNCIDADDFVYNALFKSIGKDDLDYASICTTWRDQVALISGYASEIDTELRNMNKASSSSRSSSSSFVYDEVTFNFRSLCGRTGPNGIRGVTNFKQYVELMSASGLLHGCMNSIIRLNITVPLISLLNPSISYFTAADICFIVTMFTAMIMKRPTYGRSVFSHRIPFKTVPYEVIKVIQKYTGLSDTIKAKHYEKLVDSSGGSSTTTIFQHFGWILTDHGPDGLDGKQYTVSSYI